jgi:hypothetical protein
MRAGRHAPARDECSRCHARGRGAGGSLESKREVRIGVRKEMVELSGRGWFMLRTVPPEVTEGGAEA